jgi:hypothetical protein
MVELNETQEKKKISSTHDEQAADQSQGDIEESRHNMSNHA